MADEPSPGALTLSARILGRFSTASGALRRAVAIALRREGMTVPAIASAFGVTHQRVSVLLNRSGSEPMDGARR